MYKNVECLGVVFKAQGEFCLFTAHRGCFDVNTSVKGVITSYCPTTLSGSLLNSSRVNGPFLSRH